MAPRTSRNTPNAMEVALGRTLAGCVHPYAAWRVWPAASRIALVSAYAIVTYVMVLTALLMLSTAS